MIKTNIRHHYPDIQRGCSLSIPVAIKDENDNPIDLTSYTAFFTIKSHEFDFDRKDQRSPFVKKDMSLATSSEGSFVIKLSSDDLDFAPGQYFFDIVLKHNVSKDTTRIIMCDFNLVGGPTNRQVNTNAGNNILSATGINIMLVPETPFIVYSPSLTGAQILDFERRISALEAKGNV